MARGRGGRGRTEGRGGRKGRGRTEGRGGRKGTGGRGRTEGRGGRKGTGREGENRLNHRPTSGCLTSLTCGLDEPSVDLWFNETTHGSSGFNAYLFWSTYLFCKCSRCRRRRCCGCSSLGLCWSPTGRGSESPWVEKTEEKSPVEFRVTVPDLSPPERIQDGRHARAETNISNGSPWVEKMEEKSPVEFRLTVPDL